MPTSSSWIPRRAVTRCGCSTCRSSCRTGRRALMSILLKYQPVPGVGELGAVLLRISQGLGRLQDPARRSRKDLVHRGHPGGNAPARGNVPPARAAGRDADRCSTRHRQRRGPGHVCALPGSRAGGAAAGAPHAAVQIEHSPGIDPCRVAPAGAAAAARGLGSSEMAARHGESRHQGGRFSGEISSLSVTDGQCDLPLLRRPCRSTSRASPGAGGFPGAGPATVRAAGRSLWIVIAEVPLDVYGQPALESALQDMKWVGAVAMAHEQVVEQFSRQRGSTVIPMKLFTMFSTEKRAVEATRSRAREITAMAKRIAGCEEWGVRITRRAGRVTRKPASVERPATGAAFLAARKQVRDSARDATRVAAESAVAAVRSSRHACTRRAQAQ